MKLSPEEAAKEASSKSADAGKEFTIEEVSKHSSKDDAWIVLDNNVYDVTSVLSWHPGGAAAILAVRHHYAYRWLADPFVV